MTALGSNGLEARFERGEALIREAGAMALGHFQQLEGLTIRSKGRQDLMSEADLEVELLIRQRIAETFPDDAFLGEETGRSEVRTGTGIWVVDPIDGTQPFLTGATQWCVSIGYVEQGRVEMGFVFAPARDELFVGRRGGAATLNGRPIAVSPATRIDQGVVEVGYSPRIGVDDILPVFERLLRRGGMYYRHGSGAIALCYVACGRMIGYVEPHINAWDCAGGLAVLEAAGGRANDLLAGDGLWTGGPLVVGPPMLHAELCEVLFGPDGTAGRAS
jgi:myo-inositol-1(or 4)-monophosphatase